MARKVIEIIKPNYGLDFFSADSISVAACFGVREETPALFPTCGVTEALLKLAETFTSKSTGRYGLQSDSTTRARLSPSTVPFPFEYHHACWKLPFAVHEDMCEVFSPEFAAIEMGACHFDPPRQLHLFVMSAQNLGGTVKTMH